MSADPLSRAFAALADPTRRDLVARLTVADATLTGRVRADVAVLEVDEGYSVELAKVLSPKVVVALNVQIDQLYRPGKIILKHLFSHRLIHITSPNLPRTWVLSFAIDPFLTKYECRCTTCC